jgi:hypothetical protein
MKAIHAHRAFTILLTAAMSMGCQRADPLSFTSNESGTETLLKTALGSDTLLVCVIASRKERCTRQTAEVVVDNVSGDMMAVVAVWKADDVVTLRFRSGDIRRLAARSRDGRILIQRLSPQPDAVAVEG